jgi:hypothetical protein
MFLEYFFVLNIELTAELVPLCLELSLKLYLDRESIAGLPL